LKTRWVVFGALAFMLATANLLVFNVMTGGGSLRGGQAVLSDYTGQDDGPDASSYTENLGRLTLATSWVLSGAMEKRRYVGECAAARGGGANRALPAGPAGGLPAVGPLEPCDPGRRRHRPGGPRARRGGAGRLWARRCVLHGGRQCLQEHGAVARRQRCPVHR